MSRDSSVCSGPTNDVKVVSVSLSFMLRLTKKTGKGTFGRGTI